MVTSRTESSALSSVSIRPQATKMRRFPSTSTTPQPVRRSPGSMPRMRIARALTATVLALKRPGFQHSRAHPADQRVRDLEVGIDVLHVVVLLEGLDQAQQLLALLVVDRHGVLRLPDQRRLARLA